MGVLSRRHYVVLLNLWFLLLGCLFFIIQLCSSDSAVVRIHSFSNGQEGCKELESLNDYKAKCEYLKFHNPCVSQGYIDYLHLFYCNLGRFTVLGYLVLLFWLLVLFYLLGNTASEYFCSSLESLSSLLKLSPTIAGVTLLSLGNGAPDVFASIVSFMDSGTSDTGLNTVLGSASFVTCVVVGVIGISVHKKCVRVHKSSFVRDVCFFLLVLVFLVVILYNGEINIWGAMGFASMYVVYVVIVYISHTHWSQSDEEEEEGNGDSGISSYLTVPILNGMEKGELIEDGGLEGDLGEVKTSCFRLQSSTSCRVLLCVLEMPLYLPRRLTIPVVSEERWSKPFAVISVILAPLLLAALWNSQDDDATTSTSFLTYGTGLLLGVLFGVLAYLTTENSSPPKKFLFLWLAGGFFMSMTWSYITAQELVGLLVSLGYVSGISPSILGLTVLAWGNSLGDLLTNVTMALNGGSEGAQVAISGSYAGPIFNILFGLGLSLVGSSWRAYPSSVVIPNDPYLLETLVFLACGLLWALVVLPKRQMRLDGVLGGGLLVVYVVSMSLRLVQTLGYLPLPNLYT